MLEVAPEATVNIPAAALKVPPVPVPLVQVPPGCSPVTRLYKSIRVVLLSQITSGGSLIPASGCAVILIVTTLESSTHGAVASISYLKVLEVAPDAGVNVPAAALKVPPVPVSRVQVPPGCSPVIRVNKLIAVVLLSQTTSGAASTPASGCALIVMVTVAVAFAHGAAPKSV